FDLSALFPLLRGSTFGHNLIHLEIAFKLFMLTTGLAVWIDRPERERRSIAEILSVTGALAGAAAVLVVPGLSDHAAQTSPRGDAACRGQSAAHTAAADRVSRAAGARARRGLAAPPPRRGRGAPRRQCCCRGSGALEPAAAVEGARTGRRRERARRAWAGSCC